MVKRNRVKHISSKSGPFGFWGVQDFSIKFNDLDSFFVITALLFSTFVAVGYQIDMNQAIMAIVFAIFLIGGIAVMQWNQNNKEEDLSDIGPMNSLSWMNIISLGLLGFIGIVVSQYAVLSAFDFEYLTALALVDRAFGYVAAVSEEWFFRALLLQWLIKWTRSYLIATLVDSAIFTLYHWVVYVLFLGSTAALWAVFVSSLVLCAVCILSRSLVAPILSHSLVNVGLRVMI